MNYLKFFRQGLRPTNNVTLALFGIVLMVASCTKTYTCECYSSGNTYQITSESKQGADAECETYQSDPFSGNCELQ